MHSLDVHGWCDTGTLARIWQNDFHRIISFWKTFAPFHVLWKEDFAEIILFCTCGIHPAWKRCHALNSFHESRALLCHEWWFHLENSFPPPVWTTYCVFFKHFYGRPHCSEGGSVSMAGRCAVTKATGASFGVEWLLLLWRLISDSLLNSTWWKLKKK